MKAGLIHSSITVCKIFEPVLYKDSAVQITVCMNWKQQGVESRAFSLTAESGYSVDPLHHRKGSHVGALMGPWTNS